MRNKRKVKQKWREQHCNTCIWLQNRSFCPFYSCPKVFGWSAERRTVEKRLGGKNDDSK